jgi:hypothetical protein
MARTAIAHARSQSDFGEVIAALTRSTLHRSAFSKGSASNESQPSKEGSDRCSCCGLRFNVLRTSRSRLSHSPRWISTVLFPPRLPLHHREPRPSA